MNIFFYTPGESDAAKDYVDQLRGLPVLKNMRTIPAGSLFLFPFALKLRSGDLLILFAVNTEELDELLALRNEVNGFRIILILVNSECLHKAHSLHPCFITFQEEEMTKVEAVIQKITGFYKDNQRPIFLAFRADWLTKTERGNLHINLGFLLPVCCFFKHVLQLASNHILHEKPNQGDEGVCSFF